MKMINKKNIFGLVIVIAIIIISASCSGSGQQPGRIILPGAHQFCIDQPNHEECIE